MKELNCRDVGFDCDGVVRGETEDEVAQGAAEHAREVHGLETVDAATAEKIRSQIRDAA